MCITTMATLLAPDHDLWCCTLDRVCGAHKHGDLSYRVRGWLFFEIIYIYAGEIDARMHTSSSDVEHLRRFSHSKKIEGGFCDVPTPPRMWRLRRLRRNLLEGHLANTITVGEMTK